MADDPQGTNPDDISTRVATLHRHEEEARAQDLAANLGVPWKDLMVTSIDGQALTLFPKKTLEAAQAVVIAKHDHKITLAMVDPRTQKTKQLLKEIEKQGWAYNIAIVSKTSFTHVLAKYDRFAKFSSAISGEVTLSREEIEEFTGKLEDLASAGKELHRLEEKDFGKVITAVLGAALALDASDIHIEPTEKNARIRLRIDGILQDLEGISQKMYHLVLERVKLLASLKLNVTERGQDGRFTIHARGQDIEIRASTLPGPKGEFVVLRVLNPKNLLDINELGLRPEMLTVVEEALKKPTGMILTTGPTGSGKTTMLYAFVKRVATPEIKLITIEDPIEYKIPGIEQSQVEPHSDYTFANGLRSIVRQDPDVILVGEIRDQDTAATALQAALTGHLVFSTLHTNDAPGAIPRLIELGIKPATIAPALDTILGQRLVRKVCALCNKKEAVVPSLLKKIRKALYGIPEKTVSKFLTTNPTLPEAVGCPQCHKTGYIGRIGIFEIFTMTPTMEALTLNTPSIMQVRQAVVREGMITLQQDGILRMLEGVTTLEEVERVTGPLENMEAFLST